MLLLLLFFYWHEALRAEERKPLVKTVGILTFMPSAFDRRFWLEDIFNSYQEKRLNIDNNRALF